MKTETKKGDFSPELNELENCSCSEQNWAEVHTVHGLDYTPKHHPKCALHNDSVISIGYISCNGKLVYSANVPQLMTYAENLSKAGYHIEDAGTELMHRERFESFEKFDPKFFK